VPVIRQVTMGGEAVPSALLEQVHEVFPDANVSQIYGATEFGQNVTVKDGRHGLPLSMLDEGGDVVFTIVDDELWGAHARPCSATTTRSPSPPRSGGRPETWSRSSVTGSSSVAGRPT
jgi:acyl-CoA synthetase (AMP-forming)/AMP-acid ligase II